MISIETISQSVLYENLEPNLVSRHGFFPGIVKLSSGKLLGLFVMGEAFESVDQTTWIAMSDDQGDTWELHGRLYDKSILGKPSSECLKPTVLQDGRIIAIGYRFDRSNPDRKLVNSETGGLRKAENIISFSEDNGYTWSIPKAIPLARPEALEISGPCIQLKNGDLLAGGSSLPLWEGGSPSGKSGILLRSQDQGLTWNDDTYYFQSKGEKVLPLETRFCEMSDGRVVSIVWALDTCSGKNLSNQITISKDSGRTWSDPIDTGVHAQASNLIPLEGNRLLTIHAHREGQVGLYVRMVELVNDKFQILAEKSIWDKTSSVKIASYLDMSNSLKFGQPSLTQLSKDEFISTHWAILDGQGKILIHRLKIAGR